LPRKSQIHYNEISRPPGGLPVGFSGCRGNVNDPRRGTVCYILGPAGKSLPQNYLEERGKSWKEALLD
jgi:hypothetical protein